MEYTRVFERSASMTTKECTEYIKNYLDDKTKAGSAVMLTSSWGRGKSHYIENDLIINIGQENCVKISLYGLKSLEDISKALYLALRSKKEKSETQLKIALAFRTIVRGLLSYHKLNLQAKNDEWQEIYESIDLSGKLIIFEDVERSSIPIADILGYVNNLCEQDSLKVLLVANEDVIIAKNGVSDEYYRIKEKTVSDTIIFDCSIETPIENILIEFRSIDDNFVHLCKTRDAEDFLVAVKEIRSIMEEDNSRNAGNGNNLRSLIYACQKTQDLFKLAKKNNIVYEEEFFDACLYSIIAFSLKFKRGEGQTGRSTLWTSDLNSPSMLGHIKYPLLKECYDFIMEQKFDRDSFSEAVSGYPRIRQREINWRKLKNYDKYPFHDLVGAIEGIRDLVEADAFPLEDFGTLANILFSVEATIEDIDYVIAPLLKQIKTKLEEASFCPYEVYGKIVSPSVTHDLAEQTQVYETYKQEIAQIIIQKAVAELIELTATTEGITQFRKVIDAYESAPSELFESLRPEFTFHLDVQSLVENLVRCSPNIVSEFVDGFCRIYESERRLTDADNVRVIRQGEIISELFDALPRYFKDGSTVTYLSSDDKEAIKRFKEAVERQYTEMIAEKVYLEDREERIISKLLKHLKDKNKSNIDRITKYQFSLFIDKLEVWVQHGK